MALTEPGRLPRCLALEVIFKAAAGDCLRVKDGFWFIEMLTRQRNRGPCLTSRNPQYIGGWYHLTVIPMAPQKMGSAVDEVQLYEEGILTPGFAHTVLCDEDGTLVVPEGIKAIRGAFRGRQDIKSVVLPYGIIEVGDSAFNCCEKLERVEFPASVRVISEHAFASCPKLREAHLPSGLERIESCAFAHCTALKQVEPLPSSVSVEADAFYSCPNYIQGPDRQHKGLAS